ncbi:MAG TPA: hypothetical protein VD978_24700, partial [Azospirillum sp.]|nr:hypothetical protein [Azospirillum sp.]
LPGAVGRGWAIVPPGRGLIWDRPAPVQVFFARVATVTMDGRAKGRATNTSLASALFPAISREECAATPDLLGHDVEERTDARQPGTFAHAAADLGRVALLEATQAHHRQLTMRGAEPGFGFGGRGSVCSMPPPKCRGC